MSLVRKVATFSFKVSDDSLNYTLNSYKIRISISKISMLFRLCKNEMSYLFLLFETYF